MTTFSASLRSAAPLPQHAHGDLPYRSWFLFRPDPYACCVTHFLPDHLCIFSFCLVTCFAARLEAVTTKANTVAVNTDGAQQQAVASLASSAPNMAGVLSTERQDIEGKSPE